MIRLSVLLVDLVAVAEYSRAMSYSHFKSIFRMNMEVSRELHNA